jgi:hypothetical protein
MGRLIEIAFSDERQTVVTAELLEEEAPIAAENLWEALGVEGHRARLHHGRHCAAELWCYLPEPAEPIPYENSTVFPDTGDILYYHFIQPPTRQGVWVYDLGIFYSQGQSRLPSGWLPGNRVGRVLGGDDAIRKLELVAADLLQGRPIEVILRHGERAARPEVSLAEQRARLADLLGRLDHPPEIATEADVTRVVAASEQLAQEVAAWVERQGQLLSPAERDELRDRARHLGELAAWWRFATDRAVPPGWMGSPVSYWRTTVQERAERDLRTGA